MIPGFTRNGAPLWARGHARRFSRNLRAAGSSSTHGTCLQLGSSLILCNIRQHLNWNNTVYIVFLSNKKVNIVFVKGFFEFHFLPYMCIECRDTHLK